MYSCLTRTSPAAANLRVKNDLLVPAVIVGKDHYSQGLLEIIDQCLHLDHLERPQSVFSLQKSLLQTTPKPQKTGMKKLVAALNSPIKMNKIVDALNAPIVKK
jgi:hypothetical protein